MDASESAYSSLARASPTFSINALGPNFKPVNTCPPLRELAPQPNVSFSSTTTLTPRSASTRAADRPV